MSTKLPAAFDLGSVITELKGRPGTRKAAQALSDLLDVASAHGDLLFARELLHTLIIDARGELKHPSPYGMAVRGALLAQAIVLYTRASIVKSVRKTFDIRSRLSPEQQALHLRIDGWRNEAVAHFDRSARHGEALWADETLVFTPDGGFPIRPALKRLAVRDELVGELLGQVEAVADIYMELMRGKFPVAQEALADVLERFPDVRKLVQEHPFDALSFFSTPEVASDFLGEGKLSGTLHGIHGD